MVVNKDFKSMWKLYEMLSALELRNKAQIRLWKGLATNGYVDHNDIATFNKFAGFFADYHRANGEFPSYTVVVHMLTHT